MKIYTTGVLCSFINTCSIAIFWDRNIAYLALLYGNIIPLFSPAKLQLKDQCLCWGVWNKALVCVSKKFV